MVKTLLSIEAEDPRARKILADFLTYMKGFVSLPLYIPGTPYAMAVKVHAQSLAIPLLKIIRIVVLIFCMSQDCPYISL